MIKSELNDFGIGTVANNVTDKRITGSNEATSICTDGNATISKINSLIHGKGVRRDVIMITQRTMCWAAELYKLNDVKHLKTSEVLKDFKLPAYDSFSYVIGEHRAITLKDLGVVV